MIDQLITKWQIEHALTESAGNAFDLLEAALITDAPFTMAILDRDMPGMDGIQLAKRIKESRLSDVKLMLMNSRGTTSLDDPEIEKLFEFVIGKPVVQSDFYNAMLQMAGITLETAESLVELDESLVTHFQARVLLVEDNPTNQIVAKGLLKKFGLQADVATNGVEAIESLRKINYDIVLMDCQMPVMDGYQASDTIRKPDSGVINSDVPIVAMTANAMQGDREKCLAAGMNDYIAKPVVPEKLQQALQTWLPETCHVGPEDISHESYEETAEQQASVQQDIHQTSEALSTEEPDEAVFNYEALSARMMHDEELIKMLAEEFIGDMKGQVDSLEKAIEDADLENIALHAHSIKGAAANLGGVALSSKAYSMEKAGKAGDLETVAANVPELIKAYEALMKAVQQKLFTDN